MNLRAWPELAMHGATRDSDAFVTTFVELRRSAYIHPFDCRDILRTCPKTTLLRPVVVLVPDTLSFDCLVHKES